MMKFEWDENKNQINVRFCIVRHCYRDNDVIRIISAREATTSEKEVYREWNGGYDYER